MGDDEEEIDTRALHQQAAPPNNQLQSPKSHPGDVANRG